MQCLIIRNVHHDALLEPDKVHWEFQMNDSKPFAPAADRNKQAILDALETLLSAEEYVVEIGSGTGQHACHIAAAMPGIVWQPSDLADKLAGIQQWIDESACKNILPPVVMNLADHDVPVLKASVCYTANTLHIISWTLVQALFQYAAALLVDGGQLMVYGPFTIGGEHNSEGNRLFDQQLRASDPESGIRDVHELDRFADAHGFSKATVIELPANNRLLVWRRWL